MVIRRPPTASATHGPTRARPAEIRRLCALVVLAACGDPSPPATTTKAPSDVKPMKPDVTLDVKQVSALVHARLVSLRAATTAELVVDAAASRALADGAWATLPYSSGRAGWVPLVLVADRFRVPTELGLRMSFALDATGAPTITQAPTREDLVAATTMALAGEARAFDVATAALDGKGAKPARSWAEALRVIRLDPRLPAATFAVPGAAPSWQLIFDDQRQVLIALPSFAVTLVE
ncbi:MAG: hypothetical protein NT062_07550 [Proteobacteria bacterium]|nr:hypothetical protein [Pseudomonadota bacterium]